MKKISSNMVNWGIIGVGDVCEVKSAPAMQLIQHSAVVAVMRRDGEKAKDFALRHQVPNWYDDADLLIDDPHVNAIYVATPPYVHATYTVKAARAGKPVYVEKPMARNTDECEQMNAACRLSDVPLYVAYYRRRLPNFEKLKSLLDENAIGNIRMVQINLHKTQDPDIVANITEGSATNWRVDPDVAGGGYFFDLAAHQLDYLDYVLGPIATVQGRAENQAKQYAAADTITANFKFKNGIIGTGSWCFCVGPSAVKDEMIFIGSKGQIRISFFGEPKIYLELSNNEAEVFEFELPKHIQQPLIQTVVDELMGKGVCPSTGDSAIRTNWVMHEMTKNYYNS